MQLAFNQFKHRVSGERHKLKHGPRWSYTSTAISQYIQFNPRVYLYHDNGYAS